MLVAPVFHYPRLTALHLSSVTGPATARGYAGTISMKTRAWRGARRGNTPPRSSHSELVRSWRATTPRRGRCSCCSPSRYQKNVNKKYIRRKKCLEKWFTLEQLRKMGQTLSRPDMCFDAAMVYVGDVETLTCWNNSEATSKRSFVYEDQKRIETVLLIRTRTVSFESRPHKNDGSNFFLFCFVYCRVFWAAVLIRCHSSGMKRFVEMEPDAFWQETAKNETEDWFYLIFFSLPPCQGRKIK